MSKFYVWHVSGDEFMEAIRGSGKYGSCMGILIHEMRKGYVEGLLRVNSYLDMVMGGATEEQVIAKLEQNYKIAKAEVNKNAEKLE